MVFVDVSFFSDAWVRRQAQFSDVVVFTDTDPKRVNAFFRFLSNVDGVKSAYLFKPWAGLHEVLMDKDGELRLQPVHQEQGGIFGSVAGGSGVRSLPHALEYIDAKMSTHNGVVAVFWALRLRRGSQLASLLNDFLRNFILSDIYYDRDATCVFFTDSVHVFEEDILRRIILQQVPPSTDEERREIVRHIVNTYGLNVDDRLVAQVVDATRGLTLHDVESVLLESVARHGGIKLEQVTSYKNSMIRKSGFFEVEEPRFGFEAVGGYDTLKRFVRRNIINVLRNRELAEKLGIRPPRGVLFFGVPGVGKTWFALAMAKELGLPFLRLRLEEIMSSLYGETSKRMSMALRLAEENAPAILFVDEIDRFGRRGQVGEHEETRRTFSVLLEYLGDPDRKAIIIATTNKPQDLDPAFIRVGRFDYMIPVLYPDLKARLEILRIHTSVVRKVPLLNDVDLGLIAEKTEFFSGAELEELVMRACREALNEGRDYVTMEDFEKSLGAFRISGRERVLDEYIRLAERFTNDASFLREYQREIKDFRV